VSEPLIAQGAPNALLLSGKVDRILPQVPHGSATHGAIAARKSHVERPLSFESLAAEGAQPVTWPYSVSPKLGGSRSEHPKRLLVHAVTVGVRQKVRLHPWGGRKTWPARMFRAALGGLLWVYAADGVGRLIPRHTRRPYRCWSPGRGIGRWMSPFW
jgi:hypothetical protein